MKRKVITGVLVLVMLGASSTTGFAAYETALSNTYYAIDFEKQQVPIEFISPKGNVFVQDSLLISVKILKDTSVTLSIYKETIEGPIFGPEKIEIKKDENLRFYTKQLKDLSPGNYKIQFDIEDQKEPIIKKFTIKNKEKELHESLEKIRNGNIKISTDKLVEN